MAHAAYTRYSYAPPLIITFEELKTGYLSKVLFSPPFSPENYTHISFCFRHNSQCPMSFKAN